MIERRIVTDATGRTHAEHRATCTCRTYRPRWVKKLSTAIAHESSHLSTCVDATGPVFMGRFVAGSEAWHNARLDGLGGSEIAAVLGLSPWTSHFALWHQKSGAYVGDNVNDEMQAGTLLEPAIVRKFAADHPAWNVRPNAGTWRHRDRAYQIANPDALLTTDDPEVGEALLETKFSLYADGFGEPGTDQIPIYYRCQVQWYLDVFGLRRAYLLVFVGSSAEFRLYVIDADPGEQAILRDAGEAFMASLASGVRPSIDGHDATYQVVRELHPDIADESVLVPADMAEAFCLAKHAEKAAALEARRQTSIIADHMASAKTAKFEDVVIARRQSKGGGVPYVVAGRSLPFGAAPCLEAAS